MAKVSCSSLDDCFEKGFMTSSTQDRVRGVLDSDLPKARPGMMLHRMWVQAPDSRSFPEGKTGDGLLRPAESLGPQGVNNLYVDIF